jgi:hypothetical protein
MKKNFPQNTSEFFWTRHAGFKMRQYGLSEQRIKRVVKNPKRKEEGVAKNTVAVMQPISSKAINGKEIWKQEIWVMYTRGARNSKYQISNNKKNSNSEIQNYKPNLRNGKLKIISAWRYPGVSPEKNPIPEEILRELGSIR